VQGGAFRGGGPDGRRSAEGSVPAIKRSVLGRFIDLTDAGFAEHRDGEHRSRWDQAHPDYHGLAGAASPAGERLISAPVRVTGRILLAFVIRKNRIRRRPQRGQRKQGGVLLVEVAFSEWLKITGPNLLGPKSQRKRSIIKQKWLCTLLR
jgi:hypothetical protein